MTDTAPTPPRPERRSHLLGLHGRERDDAYYWMRDDNWQAVMRDPTLLQVDIRDHLEAENSYAEAMLAPTRILRQTLFEEMKGRIKEDDSDVPTPYGPYLYWSRFDAGGQHPVYCRARAPEGATDPVADAQSGTVEVLLDGDDMAKAHAFFDLASVDPSPDHRYFAYAADTQGSELFTIRIRDLETGQDLATVIEGTAGDFVWSADARHLLYVRRDANLRPSSVWLHRLGQDPDTDTLVYEESDPSFYVGIDRTESDAFIVIESSDHDSSEVRVLDARAPGGEARLIAPRRTGHLYSVSHHGDRFYIVTNSGGAEDFRLVSAPVATAGEDHWREEVAHEPGRLILSLLLFRDFMVRLERENGLPHIVLTRMTDGQLDAENRIAFDEEAYALALHPGDEFDTDRLRFAYESPTTPAQIYDYHMTTGERILRKVQEVPSGHDPADYVTRRMMIAAPDGAQVPVTLLHHRDHPPGPRTPTLLYGYGSYGYALPAHFSVTRLSLVDRGFLYAIAHVRGGMEKGYHWYTDGKLENKINSFTDFIAVGEALAAAGMTSAGRIIAHGGSAGGLLVGAAVNLRPDLFQAVLAEVPFVDVLTTICDADLPLTPPEWTEWGNPITDVEAYDRIAGYSPYDNVRETAFPHILATAGLSDPRVTYWEPAKWVARIREKRSDDRLTLLWTYMEAGHGGATGRFDQLNEIAMLYAFAIHVAQGTG